MDTTRINNQLYTYIENVSISNLTTSKNYHYKPVLNHTKNAVLKGVLTVTTSLSTKVNLYINGVVVYSFITDQQSPTRIGCAIFDFIEFENEVENSVLFNGAFFIKNVRERKHNYFPHNTKGSVIGNINLPKQATLLLKEFNGSTYVDISIPPVQAQSNFQIDNVPLGKTYGFFVNGVQTAFADGSDKFVMLKPIHTLEFSGR